MTNTDMGRGVYNGGAMFAGDAEAADGGTTLVKRR